MRPQAPPVEARLRPLVESSPDGILIVVNLAIQYANPAAARLCGVADVEQLVGRPLAEFFHRDSAALILDRIHRALRGEDQAPGDVALVRLDGASLDFDMRASRLGDGDPPAVGVFLHDVSE